MAYRSRDAEAGLGLFLILILGAMFGAAALANAVAEQRFDRAIGSVVVAAGFVGILVYVYRMRQLDRKAMWAEVEATVARHLQTLLKRRLQLIRYDPYGKPDVQPWVDEVQYFIDTQLVPALSEGQRRALADERVNVALLIGRRVEEAAATSPAFAGFSDAMTPPEFEAYEAYCAEQLRRAGWQAYVTGHSGDQGVDVIASKDGVRLILQCKLYNHPVGNDAVQEAFAGRTFERAQYAAVVTNNTYTPAAQQLAETNGVLLLHYSELAGIEARLKHGKNASPVPAGEAR